jgi:hypothetical protein
MSRFRRLNLWFFAALELAATPARAQVTDDTPTSWFVELLSYVFELFLLDGAVMAVKSRLWQWCLALYLAWDWR